MNPYLGLDIPRQDPSNYYGFSIKAPYQNVTVVDIQKKNEQIVEQYAPYYQNFPNADSTFVGNEVSPLRTEENRRKLFLLIIGGGFLSTFLYQLFSK